MHKKTRLAKNAILSKRIIMIITIIPLLILIVICDTIYTELNTITTKYSQTVTDLEKRKLDVIDYIISDKITQLSIQNKYMTNSMEYKLKEEYNGDTKALLHDANLRNKTKALSVYNDILLEDAHIIHSVGKENINTSMFICDKYGILTNSNSLEDNIDYTEKSWDEEIALKQNKQLSRNAVYLLLNQSNDYIFWESKDIIPKYMDTTQSIIEPSKYIIRNIVADNGIEGLRNYNLLIPTYIRLDKTSNDYTIILVREVNLYTIVSPYIEDIANYSYIIEKYTDDVNSIITTKIILCIAISFLLVCSFLFCLLVVNGYTITKFKQIRSDNNDK